MPLIDWQFFFHAWDLKGKYPKILEQPAARELFDDAQACSTRSSRDGSLQARGVYGFWPAHAEGDDVVLYDGDAASASCASRRPSTTAVLTEVLATT